MSGELVCRDRWWRGRVLGCVTCDHPDWGRVLMETPAKNSDVAWVPDAGAHALWERSRKRPEL